MTLNELYQYVFENRAKADVSKIPLEKQAAAVAKKKADVQKAFRSITDNEKLANNFRSTLRKLKATDLENILFENSEHSFEAKSENPFPTDEAIHAKFAELDQHYNYFSKDPNAAKAFIALFKSCKLMADFVEENNTPNNDIAYSHTYKMLVLFGAKQERPLSLVDNYIAQHGIKFSKPIHEILVNAIPVNNPPISLSTWQSLIKKSGHKAVLLFQQAPQIEAHLKKAPSNLSEAEQGAADVTYSRAKEFPALAKLCMQYHVSEEDFNTSLEIKPKKSDLLPDMIIDGNSVGHSGYHLVKLPVDDPRAYILGHITNCCQSIGGDSERCVIDGITREKSGFYVLLKQNHKGEARAPINAGRIDHNHYDIVGQGYAWLSNLNNLTFDSWENLTPSVDDAVIVPMLKEFSAKLFKDPEKNILRVTIGTGGKTPESLSASAEDVKFPEIINDGYYQYGDADEQTLLGFNDEKAKAYEKELEEAINQQYSIPEANFKRLVDNAQSASHLAMILATVDQTNKELIYNRFQELFGSDEFDIDLIVDTLAILYKANPALINDSNLKPLLKHDRDNEDFTSIYDALTKLYESNRVLIADDNFKLLVSNAENTRAITEAMSNLSEINKEFVLTDANFKLLVSNLRYSTEIGHVLSTLTEANKELCNNDNFKLLTDNTYYLEEIDDALNVLSEEGKELITDANFKLLVNNAKYAHSIANSLSTLYEDAKELINDANCKLLASCAPNDNIIVNVLLTLYETDKKLITDDNRRLLAEIGLDTHKLDMALKELKVVNKELITDANFKLLAGNTPHAGDIAKVLVTLYKADKTLITDVNLKQIADNAQHSNYIYASLSVLGNKRLLNDVNLKRVIDNAPHNTHIYWALSILDKANKGLVNEVNFKLLIDNVQYVTDIAKILSTLERLNNALISDTNFKLLVDNAPHAANLKKVISALSKNSNDLITDANFKLLIANPQQALQVANKLITEPEISKQPETSALRSHGMFKSKVKSAENADTKQLDNKNEVRNPKI